VIGQCCNFHGINSTVENHEIFSVVILHLSGRTREMAQFLSIVEGCNC